VHSKRCNNIYLYTTIDHEFIAYEVLSDPERRRQYDSVDNAFDERIPKPLNPEKVLNEPKIFYATYGPVFFRNARFSKCRPVPDLGDQDSSREHVEAFYEFWYNFESTRSFEYLDEEEAEHAENRYDKRYLEKKNKTARLKRKTEDNARLRKLVEQAMASDPRLKAFKEQDKADKERLKAEKKAAQEQARRQSKAPSKPDPIPYIYKKNEEQKLAVQPATSSEISAPGEWTIEEMKCLITAANKIPGGSLNRWEKIADFVHNHTKLPLRPTEDIVQKCQELKHIKDPEALQREAKKKIDPRVSAMGVSSTSSPETTSSPVELPWSKEEQSRLESALRQYSPSTANRWDEIAKHIPTRTKAQIVARFKELALALRQKQQAEQK
jgi:DnaJ homolog subfamily C member 2